MHTLKNLFDRNLNWVSTITERNPEFFNQLAQQQTPEYLWIGCSDSRVPANQILDLPPGELFVHRNIANVVHSEDLNCLAVIQYAVEVLKVKHIIVCGHYGCGGVQAAMGGAKLGLIDNWLTYIKEVIQLHTGYLQKLDSAARFDSLCELNVIEQVNNVSRTSSVAKAWKQGQELTIHAWIYDLKNGLLKDLNKSISSSNEA